MYITSNYLSIVFCVLLIRMEYVNSYSYWRRKMQRTSVTGNFTSLPDDQVLLKVGETTEILCTGEDADNLELLRRDEFRGLQKITVDVVNATTIRSKVYVTETPSKLGFYCSDEPNGLQPITLIFDGPPDLRDFRCVSKNLVYLNCKWKTSNILAGFNLYVIIDEESKICDIPVHEVNSDHYDLSCTWDRNRIPRYTPEAATLHLVMEYCNYTHCLNKTFDFNHLSIVKLDPPKIGLDRIHDGDDYRLVDVRGSIPIKTFNLLHGVSKTVELWSFPNRRESIKSESIISNGNGFLISFRLPCYGEKYEVRVFVQTLQAEEKEYWSDYAAVTFKTDTFVSADGKVCEERKISETPDIMLYVIHNFRVKFKAEQSQLRRKLGELKATVAQMDKY